MKFKGYRIKAEEAEEATLNKGLNFATTVERNTYLVIIASIERFIHKDSKRLGR